MRFEEILVLASTIATLVMIYDYAKSRGKSKVQAEASRPGWIGFIRSIFSVLILVLVVRSFVAEPFRIPSSSMKPTLLAGDFVVVNKFAYGMKLPISGTKLIKIGEPKRGDVIVFRAQGSQDMIKRIVGLPGDHIKYKNKTLYVNNKPVPVENLGFARDSEGLLYHKKETLDSKVHQLYLNPNRGEPDYKFSSVTVPEGNYFMMGDNRDNSVDSRFWGLLEEHRIIGKAFATWLSYETEDGFKIRWQRIGKKII